MNYTIMSDVDIVDIMLMKASALFMSVSIGYHSFNWPGVQSGTLGTPNYLVDFEDRKKHLFENKIQVSDKYSMT